MPLTPLKRPSTCGAFFNLAAQCKMRIDELFRILGLDQPKNLVCDFCGGRDPLVRYLAEDIRVAEPETKHVAEWIACGPCSALIVQRDVDGLVASATAQLVHQLKGALLGQIIEASVRELHRQFWQAWKQQEYNSCPTEKVLFTSDPAHQRRPS